MEKVQKIVSDLKGIANGLFAKADYPTALEKYLKAIRYINLHPVLPEDTPAALTAEWTTLKTSIQLNAALCALKVSPPTPKVTITQTTAVINTLGKSGKFSDSDEVEAKRKADLAKAYYRRALGYVAQKDDERAEADLKLAEQYAPTDAGVKKEKLALVKRREAKVKAQRAAYGKMFS